MSNDHRMPDGLFKEEADEDGETCIICPCGYVIYTSDKKYIELRRIHLPHLKEGWSARLNYKETHNFNRNAYKARRFDRRNYSE